MPILIEMPSHYMNNIWIKKKTYCWNTDIFNKNWDDIFTYIQDRFNISLNRIKINNNCKIYVFDKTYEYPKLNTIINNFRYKENNKYINTILFSIDIRTH